MRVHVRVTPEHIQSGTRAILDSDPIELALMDALDKSIWYQAHVGWHSIVLWDLDGQPTSIQTPASVLDFLFRFDNGYTLEPFEFEIEV